MLCFSQVRVVWVNPSRSVLYLPVQQTGVWKIIPPHDFSGNYEKGFCKSFCKKRTTLNKRSKEDSGNTTPAIITNSGRGVLTFWRAGQH